MKGFMRNRYPNLA